MSEPVHSERITLHRLPGPMPDADLTVLLSVEGADGAWPGYWDGAAFCWADMPDGLEGLPA